MRIRFSLLFALSFAFAKSEATRLFEMTTVHANVPNACLRALAPEIPLLGLAEGSKIRALDLQTITTGQWNLWDASLKELGVLSPQREEALARLRQLRAGWARDPSLEKLFQPSRKSDVPETLVLLAWSPKPFDMGLQCEVPTFFSTSRPWDELERDLGDPAKALKKSYRQRLQPAPFLPGWVGMNIRPLVSGTKNAPENFAGTLVHELRHVFTARLIAAWIDQCAKRPTPLCNAHVRTFFGLRFIRPGFHNVLEESLAERDRLRALKVLGIETSRSLEPSPLDNEAVFDHSLIFHAIAEGRYGMSAKQATTDDGLFTGSKFERVTAENFVEVGDRIEQAILAEIARP